MTDATSAPDRIAAAFQKLLPATAKLATASDGLNKPVTDLEAQLKTLNPGVASWTTLKTEELNDDRYEEWALGYARHHGRWAILIRFVKGRRKDPGAYHEDVWFFPDSPRFMKAKAVDSLPELIEGLAAVSEKTADKLVRKTAVAQQLADAVKAQAGKK